MMVSKDALIVGGIIVLGLLSRRKKAPTPAPAPTQPAPPPGEAPPSGMGVLSVDTTPVKGRVYVDFVLWGIAPQSRSVSVGNRRVSFGAVSGYVSIPAPQTVTVAESETISVLGTYTKYNTPTTESDAKAFYNEGVADGSILPGTEIHGETYILDRKRWMQQVLLRVTGEIETESHDWWELKPNGSLLRRSELTWVTGDYECVSEMTYYEYYEDYDRYTQGLYGCEPGERYYLPGIVDTIVPSWAYDGPARATTLEGLVALGVPKEALDIGWVIS